MLKFLRFILSPNLENWFEKLAVAKLENCKNEKAIVMAMVESRMRVVYRMRGVLCFLVLIPISGLLVAFNFYFLAISVVILCIFTLGYLNSKEGDSICLLRLIDIHMLMKYGEDSQEYKDYKLQVNEFIQLRNNHE